MFAISGSLTNKCLKKGTTTTKYLSTNNRKPSRLKKKKMQSKFQILQLNFKKWKLMNNLGFKKRNLKLLTTINVF